MKQLTFLAAVSALMFSILMIFSGLCYPSHLMTYQGILTDLDGRPLGGIHDLAFRIYADSVSDAAPLWVESHTAVEVSNGLISVILGSKTAIEPGLFAGGPRWLGIQVDADPELSPRVAFTSVPWALRAATADSVITTSPAGHSHDDRYYTKPELRDPGTLNDPANPVDWTKLKSVPSGFADNVDNEGGLTLPYSGGIATPNAAFAVTNLGEGDAIRGETSHGASAAVMGAAPEKEATVNYGGRFEAFGSEGRGVSGLAGQEGDVENIGGHFTANGLRGRGVCGYAPNKEGTESYGGCFESGGLHGRGVYGAALNEVRGEKFGGYFRALGDSGRGACGRADGALGYGVMGVAPGIGGQGIHGVAEGMVGVGVCGEAPQGFGVKGLGQGRGGWFEASSDYGVGAYGYGHSKGVMGVADGGAAKGVYGYAATYDGVGVYGEVEGDAAVGVYALAEGDRAVGMVAKANGPHSIGLKAMGDGAAGVFSGNVDIQQGGLQVARDADFYGNVMVRVGGQEKLDVGNANPWTSVWGRLTIYGAGGTDAVMELGEGLDYAEGFDMSLASQIDITPGSVVVIDSDAPGKLRLSDAAYDTKVAGIVAGAAGLASGVRLGVGQFDFDVALAGRVFCNVDATDAGIEPGDLLTTSSTPGYAMKVADGGRAQGAILGKAMQRLEKGGKGQILVLVSLQ